jgi:hypothetical protein
MTVLAFIADDDSGVAWVFEDEFSAVRGPDGTWKSPAPDAKLGDFMDEYSTLPPAEALALSKEARMALKS